MTKASAFTVETTIADADQIPFIKDPGGTPLNRIITKANFVGGKPFAVIIKSADESVTSSTTLQDDNELTVALKANKRYYFFCFIFFVSDVTPDFKYAFSIPSGTTNRRGTSNWSMGVAEGDTTAVDSTSTPVLIDADESTIFPSGYIITSGTAGNFTFQFAQNTSDGTSATVKAGSTLVVYEA